MNDSPQLIPVSDTPIIDAFGNATYIGAFDMSTEELLPSEMRRELHMFNLLKPLGKYPADATITLEALRDELSITVQEPLNGWKKGDIV